jgi:hypothetical protein
VADELMRQVAGDVFDIAILYRPQKLPVLRIEELLEKLGARDDQQRQAAEEPGLCVRRLGLEIRDASRHELF